MYTVVDEFKWAMFYGKGSLCWIYLLNEAKLKSDQRGFTTLLAQSKVCHQSAPT